jgi:nucleoside-diphosphate-sugar epimerase
MNQEPNPVILTEPDLDDVLTRPGGALLETIGSLSSPLVILGAGGKMGPTLAVLARRAAQAAGHDLRVVAVSRFSDRRARAWLEAQGVETVACDLWDALGLAELPDTPNVVSLIGMKFGTAVNPSATWALNTVLSARIAERYRDARLVVLSTGNVYPQRDVSQGGATESEPLTPLGEYPNAAVGRERVCENYSHRNGTRMALLRLFYAVELRYGVLVDIARKVHRQQPIDLAQGYFNCIWQGDANQMVLRSLALASSPAAAWNLCLPEVFSVRHVAEVFAQRLGRAARFVGHERSTALLGDPAKLCSRLGAPAVQLPSMIEWIARWIEHGGRDLGKPTEFEVWNGSY